MLGFDVAGPLEDLRAQAESLMVDSCMFRSPDIRGEWDDATGTYAVTAGAVMYSGPCRVRDLKPGEQYAEPGNAPEHVRVVIVSLPAPAGFVVRPGQVGEVATAAGVLEVRPLAQHVQSHQTAVRVPCEVVVRDAG